MSARLRTLWRDTHPTARRMMVAGAVITAFFLVIAVFAPLVAPFGEAEFRGIPQLAEPGGRHWFGTTNLRYDVFSRVVFGARLAFEVVILSTVLAMAIGVPLGLISGYTGRWLDRVLVLVMDAMYAFPSLLLAIVAAFALRRYVGQGVPAAALSISVIYIPQYFRVVRNHTLSVREETFVDAARAMGAPRRTILGRYVLLNVVQSVPVIFTVNAADAILTLAALGFLGYGVQVPAAEWGYDISRAISDVGNGFWWTSLFPGLFILLLVTGLTLLGEGINDIVNPLLRRRGLGAGGAVPGAAVVVEPMLATPPVEAVTEVAPAAADPADPHQAPDGVSAPDEELVGTEAVAAEDRPVPAMVAATGVAVAATWAAVAATGAASVADEAAGPDRVAEAAAAAGADGVAEAAGADGVVEAAGADGVAESAGADGVAESEADGVAEAAGAVARPAEGAGAGARPAALSVRDLRVTYRTGRGPVTAVDGVALTVARGESVGLVGESGCGKSSLGRGILGILPPGATLSGQVLVGDDDLVTMSPGDLRRARGERVALAFQEPMTRLDPLQRVEDHFVETIRAHRPEVSRKEARVIARDALAAMRIPPTRARAWPHEFSGGMRQRIMIALAIVLDPEVLVADEPTTSLDVIVEAQILAILDDLRHRTDMALLLVTHNLGIVAETCDRVAVMYAGKLVEQGGVTSVFAAPRHPYTQGLLASVISLDTLHLSSIPGAPPDLLSPPTGCRFAPRCPFAMEVCRQVEPVAAPVVGPAGRPGVSVDGAVAVACHLYPGADPRNPGRRWVPEGRRQGLDDPVLAGALE